MSESHSVMSDSLQPHDLYSPWNSLGQNTGVGSLFLSPGDLPNPGIELGSPALQTDSLPTDISGKPTLSGCLEPNQQCLQGLPILSPHPQAWSITDET